MTLAVNTDENKRNIPSATMSSVRETPFCLSVFLSLRQRDANFPADPSASHHKIRFAYLLLSPAVQHCSYHYPYCSPPHLLFRVSSLLPSKIVAVLYQQVLP